MQQQLTNQQAGATATITTKGQVTIPLSIRQYLGIQKGDKISFIIEGKGNIRLQTSKYPTIASLRGVAGKLKKPLAWKEMKRIAHEDRNNGAA